ncbi:nuclease-related domain-containing protein [Arthrobacter alpinus]|nr:nuclease-related domain-containing protein [Arthrobacter alpinus]
MAKLLDEQAKLPPQRFMARLFGTTPLGPDSKSWYKGALGEIEVGKVLAGMGSGWEVLHSVPVGKADTDIDHVVIGPAGVFTLNTKNHSGQKVWVGGNTFMVNGTKTTYISKAVSEARRAARVLGKATGREVNVAALLVLIEPRSLTVKTGLDGVEIVNAGNLRRWFSRQPHILHAAEVERLAAAARAPGAWHENPQIGDEPTAVEARFASLNRHVKKSTVRRTVWRLGVGAAFLTAAMVGGTLLPPILGTFLAGLAGG